MKVKKESLAIPRQATSVLYCHYAHLSGYSQGELIWWTQTIIAAFVYLSILVVSGIGRDLSLKAFETKIKWQLIR